MAIPFVSDISGKSANFAGTITATSYIQSDNNLLTKAALKIMPEGRTSYEIKIGSSTDRHLDFKVGTSSANAVQALRLHYNTLNATFAGDVKGATFNSIENAASGGFPTSKDYLLAGTGDRGGGLIVNDISGARHAISAGGYDLTFSKETNDGSGTLGQDIWMRANAASAAGDVTSLEFFKNASFSGSVDVGTFTLAGSGIVADAGMTLQIGGGSVNALTLADSSGNATFAGNVSVNGAGQKAVLHVKNEGNNWEDGVLLEHDSGDTGWNIHPENSSDNALWFGYNSDTSVALTSQAATAALKLNSDLSATFAGTVTATHFYGDGSNLTGILTNPLNSDLTINSAGDAASPILRLNNSSSNTFNHALEAINANLTAGETELLLFGKATNTRNSGFIGFNWNADNSDTNYVTIGHWGYNHLLKIFPTGNATFAGNITCGQIDATSFTDVITNTIMTASGDLDIKTVLTGRDVRFRGGSNNVQFRVKGDNTGVIIHDIASLRAASVTSATTTTVVASVAHATYNAAFFDFVIKNGTNVRAGTVYACHNGASTPLVEFAETSTVDLGDTSDVTLNVVISGANMILQATTTSNTWTIKSLIRAI